MATTTPEDLVDRTPVPDWAKGAECVKADREDYEVWKLRRDGETIGWMYDEGNGYDFAEGAHNVPTTTTMTTTFTELDNEIGEIERRLAPGSETSIYGHFVARMRALGGPRWRESDTVMTDEDAAWWRRAYELYEADRDLPAGERAEDVQDIFDRA